MGALRRGQLRIHPARFHAASHLFQHNRRGAGVSDSEYLAWWAYATSISTAIVAVLGPTLGTLSDLRGVRKKIFSVSILVGALGCAVLGFVQHWIWFLVLFVLAKSAYQLSLVVYDSMLCDVSARERMDEVSSRGYSVGVHRQLYPVHPHHRRVRPL